MTASEFIRKKMLLSNGEEYRTGNNLNKAKVEEMAGIVFGVWMFSAILLLSNMPKTRGMPNEGCLKIQSYLMHHWTKKF